MKKMNKKEIKVLIKKLKPYWKKYENINADYFKKLKILEKEMNKKVKAKTYLEFFHVDGECVGIGAENYSNRKWFPLIHDMDFRKN